MSSKQKRYVDAGAWLKGERILMDVVKWLMYGFIAAIPIGTVILPFIVGANETGEIIEQTGGVVLFISLILTGVSLLFNELRMNGIPLVENTD